MIQYDDWRVVPAGEWFLENFTPKELACPHCDALMLDEEAGRRLQSARWLYGKPIVIASAYRCKEHNSAVGGSANSAHTRGAAFDPQPQAPADLADMLAAFWKVGWLGFGMGAGKLHFDYDRELGRRSWYYGK